MPATSIDLDSTSYEFTLHGGAVRLRVDPMQYVSALSVAGEKPSNDDAIAAIRLVARVVEGDPSTLTVHEWFSVAANTAKAMNAAETRSGN